MSRVSRLVLGLSGIAVVWLLITFYMYLQHEKVVGRQDAIEQATKGVEVERTVKESEENYGSPYIRILTQKEQELFLDLAKKEDLTQSEGVILDLLNEKFTWIVDGFHNTKECIKQKLERENSASRIIGWKVKLTNDDTCLVSYTYEREGKTYGWFFDVKSGGRVVTDVSSDHDLMEKYHLVHTDEYQEKLSKEENVKPNLSKLEQFRRHQEKGNREALLEQEKRILLLKTE
ncbi:MAG: hypothetical protein D8M57_09315 [Candidatus Scalindua sp. AMX11]|nr:MAG: hypothetical protein DWQ00_00455 [Candidatus Scalindua sp.]NOG83010.1 hypothetical protein [Planctomycetota bacterium]RZV79588.1 MAG: hypothetical protein EX341_11180 [Candidatus Scalindua sp. SCAELEC01]TDE65229.1 MAG: hypothetical protein D8M57_09315 [Candidatus Scalindua sp. AMX11]GJQ58534.1 MAG: hypothetical protein SCALA701_13350 [Candidatus Scalindua sp.]